MQKQITLSDKEVLLVEVPDMTGNITLRTNPACDNGTLSFYNVMDNNREVCTLIPPGDWSIVGVWPDITEEQVGEVVETQEWEWGAMATPDGRIHNDLAGIKTKWRRDYSTENTFTNSTALESLRSLLISHGVDVSKRWVVLINDKIN